MTIPNFTPVPSPPPDPVRQTIGNITLLAAMLALWVVVAGCVVYTWRAHARARDARDWPTVRGHLTQAAYRTSLTLRNLLGGMTTHWTVDVMYRYRVEGREYSGARLCFGGWYTYASTRAALKEEYKRGQRVDVHYDPDNPSRAVIRVDFDLWDTLPMGTLSVVFPLAMAATRPLRRLILRPFRRKRA